MSQYGILAVRSAHNAELRPSVGGYSRGLQFVRVRMRRGRAVVASDPSHCHANFEDCRPFPIVCDVSETLEGYNTMRSTASSLAHIAPGRAPLVLKRYPSQSGGPEDIARLGAKSLN